MSCHVDNTVVCTPIEHMLYTSSLYEIHLCILILSLLHVHSCTMEDNPLLVDMWLVVMLISLLTSSHINCLYIQGTSMMYSSNHLISNYLINPFPFDHSLSLLCYLLSFQILAFHSCFRQILTWYQSYTKFLHGIRAIGVSLHSHWRDFFCRSRLELAGANQMLASHSESQKTPKSTFVSSKSDI